METAIWRFRTREGSVRLHVGVERERMQDLHGELTGCAVVADSMEEFLTLSARVTSAYDAILADVMRQPWPKQSLKDQIRRAAHEADVLRAMGLILDSATAASDSEASALLEDTDQVVLLSYLRSVARSLDEQQERFLQDLATALRVDLGDLIAALDRAGD